MQSDPQSPRPPAATLMYAPTAALKGRGTVWALEHRFTKASRAEFDDGWGTLQQAAEQDPASPVTQVVEESVGRA